MSNLLSRQISLDMDHVMSIVHDCCNPQISESFIKEILNENDYVFCELYLGGFDTVGTELLVDAVSKKLIGKRWPIYGDSQKYKLEFKELWDEACKKLGDK